MRTLLQSIKAGESFLRYTNPKKYARQLTLRGEVLENEGLHTNAIEIYRKALSIYPECDRAIIRLGHALRRVGKLDEALQHFQIIQKRPFYDYEASKYYSVEAIKYDRMGALFKQMGDLDMATDMYKKAIALETYHGNAHNGLGKIYCMQGEYEKAEGCFRTALGCLYNSYWTHNNLGIALLLLKREEEAFENFQRTIAICQDTSHLRKRPFLCYFNLGVAHTGKKEYAEGLQALNQATSMCVTPSLIQEVIADLNLIEKARLDGKTDEAILYMESVISQS